MVTRVETICQTYPIGVYTVNGSTGKSVQKAIYRSNLNPRRSAANLRVRNLPDTENAAVTTKNIVIPETVPIWSWVKTEIAGGAALVPIREIDVRYSHPSSDVAVRSTTQVHIAVGLKDGSRGSAQPIGPRFGVGKKVEDLPTGTGRIAFGQSYVFSPQNGIEVIFDLCVDYAYDIITNRAAY